MTYTYTQDVAAADTETAFVPSYARRAVKTKKVKTWMVLAPIAGLALIGGAAAMLMTGGGETQPLTEPEAAPVVASQPAPLSSAPLTATPAPAVVSTPVAPAPVGRSAEPARRAEVAPVRRAAPAAPRVQAPVTPTSPQAYEASPSTPAPSTPAPVMSVPAPAPVVAPPAPSIPVQPLS